MKKVLLTILTCIISIAAVAQEVRGIETRRVIYDGPEYYCGYNCSSTKYYGWELKNRNSCVVSVDVSLWMQALADGNNTLPAHIVKTQTVVLEVGETYVFKREEHHSTRVDNNDTGWPISTYYLEYKAFKLQ